MAVFDAKPTVNTSVNRDRLLSDLTSKARLAGLKVDKSALAYSDGPRITFYGDHDLVEYLRNAGVSIWTHWLDA